MKAARTFSERTGLLTGELLEIAIELDKDLRLPSSMIMLGKSLFALLREDEIEKIKATLADLTVEKYHICDVYTQRPSVERGMGGSL